MTRFLIPLAVFLLLAVFLAIGLSLNPREVPSPLIDKPAPEFSLAQLRNPERKLSLQELRGQVWMLNVWASWCVSCRDEHRVLQALADQNLVPIVGLNYKDKPGNARQWLADLGDPYTVSVIDREGRAGIDWGVYGVPETFLIDRQGVIRYKHIGPVDFSALSEKLIPKIKSLVQQS